MASAIPDPNVNLQLQGSHCGFAAFLSCRRTASIVKKYIFWTICIFSKSIIKKNGGIIWKKEHVSIIWPKKKQCY